jgi:hypothetical protein
LLHENDRLEERAYTIFIDDRTYYLVKVKEDFIIEPAIGYLDGESCDDPELDINLLAEKWREIGYSYLLSYDDSSSTSLKDFYALTWALCSDLHGVVLIMEDVFGLNKAGLYSIKSMEKNFAGLA